MKKILLSVLIMLIAFSIVLVSCDNNPGSDKAEEKSDNTETVKPKQNLDSATETLLKNQYSKLITAFGEIEKIAGKKSESNYTENITFDIRTKNDEPLTLIDNGDLANAKEGKTYTDSTVLYRTVTDESNSAGESETDESDTGYQYITFEIKYENVTAEGKTELSPLEKTLTFKEAGDDKTEQKGSTVAGTDTIAYNETSVYKDLLALLKLYCPDTGSFTLDSNAISAVLKIVDQSPVIHIEKDFGTTGENDSRVVLNADLFLSADNGSILINLESAEVSIVSNKDNSSNRIISIVTPEESELVLTLEDDFRLGLEIARTDSDFSLDIDRDYIQGRVVLSFSDLKVDAVWDADNQGGASVYSLGLDGSATYDFTSGAATVAATITEKSNPLFPIEALVRFEGNTKAAEETDDWETFMKGFTLKSFKFGSYDINPDSMSELLSTYGDKLVHLLSDLFADEESSEIKGTDEEIAAPVPSAL